MNATLQRLSDSVRRSGAGQWYLGREAKERRILALLGLASLVLILWAFIWKPVSDWKALAVNDQQVHQQLLDWLRSNEDRARAASDQNTETQGSRALIPIINRAAKAHNLSLNRLQPESNGVVSVVLQEQSFNQIILWTAQLEENNGVIVERATFDAHETPGNVNAQIRLN